MVTAKTTTLSQQQYKLCDLCRITHSYVSCAGPAGGPAITGPALLPSVVVGSQVKQYVSMVSAECECESMWLDPAVALQ